MWNTRAAAGRKKYKLQVKLNAHEQSITLRRHTNSDWIEARRIITNPPDAAQLAWAWAPLTLARTPFPGLDPLGRLPVHCTRQPAGQQGFLAPS